MRTSDKLFDAKVERAASGHKLGEVGQDLLFFCLERLSRHYLPPVAASGEKDESKVRSVKSCTEAMRCEEPLGSYSVRSV